MANETGAGRTPGLQLTIVATAAILSGCASSGPSSAPLVPETVSRVSDGPLTVEIFNKPGVRARTVPASIDSVWEVLSEVYERLEIPVALRLPQQRVLGNRNFRARRIEGKRLSTYLDCGRGMTSVPYADEYAVTMLALTQLSRGEGGTTVSGGNLTVTNSGSIGSGPLTLSSGGTITFGNTQTVSSLGGSGGTINFPGETLTIAQASTTSYSGSISASGGTLAKSGDGTLSLSGGSTVSLGTVSVTGGTLTFNRSTSASVGAAQVSGGATLSLGQATPFSGSSTTLSLDSGTMFLGSEVTQTFGGLTLGTAGSNTINFNSTTTSTLTFSATPSGSGTVNITNYNYASDPQSGGPSLRITGSPSGALSFFTIGGSPAMYYGASDILVAVPEPSTYAALSGALVLGAAVYRRRQAKSRSA